MQTGNYSKSDVITKVERIVCDCVNRAFSVIEFRKYEPISPSNIYEGNTNVDFPKRLARQAVFVISHDRFGISYNNIKSHSGITARNIIRSIKSYKYLSDCDRVVSEINRVIEEELKKFPIV